MNLTFITDMHRSLQYSARLNNLLGIQNEM